MYVFFKEFASKGRERFNDDLCHYVDKEEKIFQFVKGDLRILWFYADVRKVIICTHGFVKDSNKTPKSETRRAIAEKDRYLRASRAGTIEFDDD